MRHKGEDSSHNATMTSMVCEPDNPRRTETNLMEVLDTQSFERVVELKIARFLEQVGDFFPDNLHALFMNKTEKPLIQLVLQRTGGNQVHAARILGINRNTLRKKIKIYDL